MRFRSFVLCLVSILSACSPADPPTPRKNRAIVVAKMLNLQNLECVELATGWGFTPDTAVCQSAAKQGDIRVPEAIVWCSAGDVGEPVCKAIADMRPKKP